MGELLSGFARTATSTNGYDIHVVKAWDYPALVEAYAKASATARKEHVPQIIHVIEVTQPQGHPTSGSHERYKSAERLAWEAEMDGVARMRTWMIDQGIASVDELEAIDAEAVESVKSSKQAAWDAYIHPIQQEIAEASSILRTTAENLRSAARAEAAQEVEQIVDELARIREPFRRDIMSAAHGALVASAAAPASCSQDLAAWRRGYDEKIRPLYSSHLHCETSKSPLRSGIVHPDYGSEPQQVNGSEVS